MLSSLFICKHVYKVYILVREAIYLLASTFEPLMYAPVLKFMMIQDLAVKSSSYLSIV
jgi:hypothetical protein